ncbi:hypothetical protein CAP48_01770 [Advenella sp. S44]|uniref:enoyl-CoA hydratase/isomerase family protein n=1 Tax=Advenella sp. S44 TaxID=1982755 RepID=UPI000C2AF01E|nr:enoyl-CoA hydratase-related protein [Advenella sp. S44]PJX27937.1 hypothetical protein CAP48_01770 [Advenella sp. S44]
MESKSEQLLVRQRDGIGWILLNRPMKRNAITHEMYESLYLTLLEMERNTDIGCVVLSGNGTEFCAGGDVGGMSKSGDTSCAERIDAMRKRTRVIERLHLMDKPTIAMMKGNSVGAGMSLALACDLRIGDATTKMRTGFLSLGLSGDYGIHYFLPRIVGEAKAREIFLLSRTIAAPEALALGLLNQMVNDDMLEEQVIHIASTLACAPQPALGFIKQNLSQSSSMTLSEMLDIECERHIECTESQDHTAAVHAFLKKKTVKRNLS